MLVAYAIHKTLETSNEHFRPMPGQLLLLYGVLRPGTWLTPCHASSSGPRANAGGFFVGIGHGKAAFPDRKTRTWTYSLKKTGEACISENR